LPERDERTRAQLRKVGARIRQLRRIRGYASQEQFALAAGFGRAYYNEIETGNRNVGITNLIRLATTLRTEVGNLFPPLANLTEGEVLAEEFVTEGTQPGSPDWKPFSFAGIAGLTHDEVEGGEAARASEGNGEIERREEVVGTKREKVSKKGQLISTGAAARLLGITQRTLERWTEKGALPVVDFVDDRVAVFLKDDIVRLASVLSAQRERANAVAAQKKALQADQDNPTVTIDE
jgi:transcriptional regulator with XRE-family HTH domain